VYKKEKKGMKVHVIPIVLIAFLASTLVLVPVEAKPPKSGVVEISPPAKVNLSEIHIATTGPNVNIFPNSQPQNEPTIAINLGNNNILAAGANDYSSGDSWAGTYYSINGGAIWSAGLIPKIGSLAAYSTAGDPWISFAGANIAYYSGIAFNRQTAPNAVFLATSNNGGATFNNPTIVESTTDPNIFHDKPWNAADGNNVYVVWTKFQSGMSPIVFKASNNQGATFGSEVAVSEPGNNQDQGSQVAVGPGGVIYVAWEDFNINRFLFDKSANGGGSFGIDTQVTSIVPIPSPLPNKAFRTNSFPYMAVNKNNGNIYIVWNDYRNGDSDILFTKSTDSGATWSAPIRVNDDPLHNGKDQFFPAISVDQSNGKINIVFYDSRNDPNNHMIDLYYAESTNGGLSFEPNQRVTTVASDPSLDGFGGQFIGDYIGLASGTGNHHPVWADIRTGNADIFTDSLASLVPHLASIVVSPSTASLTVGETQNFNATALDQYNNPMTGISISWTLSNSTVGSVTPSLVVTDTTGNASTTFTASVSGNTMVNATNGSITGNISVAVSSVPSQNLTIFARGGDNALWYRQFDGTSWSDWQSLGGSITNLDVISLSEGNIYTFVGGTDGG
jgi:hypothetical protein